jgi:uncharacterized FlaG/YvyC family protein
MDAGSINRIPIPSAANAPQRTDTLAAAGAVKTELRPESAVQQVREVEPVRFEQSNDAASRASLDEALRETISRRIELDPKSREVVFQTVSETGEVIRQVPAEALLRLRTYLREMREKDVGSDVRRVEKIA